MTYHVTCFFIGNGSLGDFIGHGGGGFLGGAIVRRLLARGDTVRSFTRSSYPWLTELGVRQIPGDLGKLDEVKRAFEGVEIVYHVAAKAGVWGRYNDYYHTNVTGTENVLKACQSLGIRKLVYTSTPSVVHSGGDIEGVNESMPYPKHFEANYPQTKAIAEQAVLSANGSQLATVALRPHLIWGQGDPHLVPRLLRMAQAGKLKRIGKRNVQVDVTYIDNAAEAHILAGEKIDIASACAGKAYFISDGKPVVLWDFLNRILTDNGLSPVHKSVPAWLAKFVGLSLENCVTIVENPSRATDDEIRREPTEHFSLVRHLRGNPRSRLPAGREYRRGVNKIERIANTTTGNTQMKRETYSTGSKWEPIVGYSRAVKVGQFVFVSGTTASGPDGKLVGIGDPYAQTVQILKNIENALKNLGATMSDVVRTTIYLTDISQWELVGKAHGEFFQENRPATALLEVSKLISPDMLVEIEADAIIAG